MVVSTVVVTVLFLILVPWVQTTAGAGRVTALNPNDRMQDINALVAGRIDQFYVRDGSIVEKGDPIVKLVDNDPNLLQRLELERVQVQAKINAATNAMETAEIDVRRSENLFDQGLASRREFEQARIKAQELRSKLAEAEAEMNRIDINLSRQSVQTVRAPRAGRIIRVNAGDNATFINAGDRIATFVPADVERAVELYIDGRDVALVTTGAHVRLQFEGWPVIQLSGWPSIAVGTFDGIVTAVDPSASANGRFRVLVIEDPNADVPWPDERFVRFGAKARGWVLLEEVRVGYEIWRQLNNFPPDFPGQGGADSAAELQ
ncbi:RND efflux membrane fusion protein [Luminiphilus syltensis NOR5-1B]|uniref:RND efflux membrane fusion protein n=2 Tax=Luminiphilus TaxID=1341118 RepID=B8KV29_9GAMM|nr:RND efflux membrane fusion protein [Luminiphilus syltensis NOR5-1B]